MNLETLKQEAREELAAKFSGAHSVDWFQPQVDTFLDTLIDKVVSAVEASVVPEPVAPLRYINPECSCGCGDGYGECRTAVLQAFAKFRGV